MEDFYILLNLSELNLMIDAIERKQYDCESDSKEWERCRKMLAYLESQKAVEEKLKNGK